MIFTAQNTNHSQNKIRVGSSSKMNLKDSLAGGVKPIGEATFRTHWSQFPEERAGFCAVKHLKDFAEKTEPIQ